MTSLTTVRGVALLSIAAILIGGCARMRGASTQPQASTPPATAGQPATSKVGPGMNERGDVVDSKKVKEGFGRKVKGINDWEGEITGNPAPTSKFTKLQIGMSAQQVIDLIGPPTDQGGYVTGKAFIPFYYGSDRSRYEMAYKGQGRLIFASRARFGFGGSNLIWIVHNPNDTGYR